MDESDVLWWVFMCLVGAILLTVTGYIIDDLSNPR